MTNLPKDLILMRHFQSEGNEASRREWHQNGDESAYTDCFRTRHTASWRLTDHGRKEAQQQGEWMRANGYGEYDTHIVSSHNRTLESAGFLELPNANWQVNPLLREKDNGYLSGLSIRERNEQFPYEMAHEKRDHFYFRTPGGESIADVWVRILPALSTISGERAIVVIHGETLRAFQSCLQGVLPVEMNETLSVRREVERTFNGQIHHYTRIDPWTGIEHETYVAMKSFAPLHPEYANDWQPIIKRQFSNQDLLQIAAKTKRSVV